MASKGRFVWHELMTTDVDAALAFYTEVIGWKTQPFEGAPADKPYTMFCVGDQPIGGLMLLPDEAKAAGAPPHWMGHVSVPDLDATIAKANELGATVHHQMEIPEVGRFAIVADPQGAVASYFTPKEDMPPPARAAGMIDWNELNTTDYEAAWTYYRELFAWEETEAMDMGPEMGTYFMFKNTGGERSIGGMSNAATAMSMPPNWLYYISVENLDDTIGRLTSKGGYVVNGPMDVPGGRIAQCMDPQGAAFAIYADVPETQQS